MRVKCYFCNIWLNNSVSVRMYDGRIVESCHICRGLVADAKSIHHRDNSVFGIVTDRKSHQNDSNEHLIADSGFGLSSSGKDERKVIK